MIGMDHSGDRRSKQIRLAQQRNLCHCAGSGAGVQACAGVDDADATLGAGTRLGQTLGAAAPGYFLHPMHREQLQREEILGAFPRFLPAGLARQPVAGDLFEGVGEGRREGVGGRLLAVGAERRRGFDACGFVETGEAVFDPGA